jgi:uncharacterized protein (DUF1501 family)
VITETAPPIREQFIMATTNAGFVRQLHAMRASGAVLERDDQRWIITRIEREPRAAGAAHETWGIFGRRARPGR